MAEIKYCNMTPLTLLEQIGICKTLTPLGSILTDEVQN